jgi:TrmH family RNA methyltransferase
MGAIFNTSIHYAPNLAEYFYENYKGFEILGATIHTDKTLNSIKVTKKFGLVMGNESKGISQEVEKILTGSYKIEGFGSAESLNVAIAAGISMYHFKGFLK